MNKDEKRSRFSVLEKELKAKWIDFISKEVDKKLPNNIGTLHLIFKDKDVSVMINVDEANYSSVFRFEVDDIHVWHYIVNDIYLKNEKIVGFNVNKDNEGFTPLVFDCDFSEHYSRIWSDDEFMKLCQDIYGTTVS